jgi:hypothetical protein
MENISATISAAQVHLDRTRILVRGAASQMTRSPSSGDPASSVQYKT